jgi:hypothetical protein
MCNGKLRGVAQWLSGSTAYVIAFEVPTLTTSFPGATSGQPKKPRLRPIRRFLFGTETT